MKMLLTLALLASLSASPSPAAPFAGTARDSAASWIIRTASDGITVREASRHRVTLVLGRGAVSTHPAAPSAWTMKLAARW